MCARMSHFSYNTSTFLHEYVNSITSSPPPHVTDSPTMHLMWEKGRFSMRGAVQKASFNTQRKEE